MGDRLDPVAAAILEAAPDIVIVLDGKLEILALNERAKPLASRAGLLPTHGRSTDTNTAWATVLARALRGEVIDFAVTIEGASYEAHVHPVPTGRPPDLVVVHATDVTALKDVARSHHRLLEAVPDLVAVVRSDGTVVESKDAQDPTEELSAAELGHPRVRAAVAETLRTGASVVFEHEVVAGGVPRTRSVRVRALGSEDAVVVVRDVTAQRQLVARAMVADRMASLGTLAAGVAHELNNPLAYVSANVGYVEEELVRGKETGRPPALEPLVRALGEAREGLERMSIIVRDLKTFSRPDEETLVDIDVNALLDRVLGMAMKEIRHVATVEKSYGPVPPVRGNEARLGQVFLNLLVNAAQAFGPRPPSHNVVRLRTAVRGGQVVVEVADNGPGIPPEHRARVFDPFFTTKPAGVGTGLGLAICLGIVKGMRGDIELDSAAGEGTIFRVVLAPATVAAPKDDGWKRTSLGRIPVGGAPAKRSILIVDDDPRILSAMTKLLREHDVACAASAADALARLERGETYDAILCDVMMPGTTGPELYEQLCARRPETAARFVFMTGGAVTPQTQGFLERTNAMVLEKPFGRDAVRACLDRLDRSMLR